MRFFAPILSFPTSFSPLFSSILPKLLALFRFSFFRVPHQDSNHLPFAYISLTSLSSTPLHHEIQLRFIPPKLENGGPRRAHQTPLARLSIHGAGHQTQEAPETRRSRHQSIGQAGQTARHRLQSGRCQDDQGHRQVTGQQISGRKDGQGIMQAKKRLKL